MSRSFFLVSLPPVLNVFLCWNRQWVVLIWSWPLRKQTKEMGVIDNEVNIWFLSLLSEPWPFECCANRPSASHRISGSCGDQEDEREAPEKEAGQSQWNHLYRIFWSNLTNVYRTVSNGFETSRPTPVLVNSPRLPSPLATTTTTKMTTTMISSRYKGTLSSTLER